MRGIWRWCAVIWAGFGGFGERNAVFGNDAECLGGRYVHARLPARYGGAQMPEVSAIDLRLDKPDSGILLRLPCARR